MLWLKLLWGIMTKKSIAASAVVASSKVKIGGSVAAISTAAGLMFTYVDGRITDVKAAMTDKEIKMVRYVDTKHSDVKDSLGKIEKGVDKLDNRIYELIKQLNQTKKDN